MLFHLSVSGHTAGISKKAVKLRPIAVIKGWRVSTPNFDGLTEEKDIYSLFCILTHVSWLKPYYLCVMFHVCHDPYLMTWLLWLGSHKNKILKSQNCKREVLNGELICTILLFYARCEQRTSWFSCHRAILTSRCSKIIVYNPVWFSLIHLYYLMHDRKI